MEIESYVQSKNMQSTTKKRSSKTIKLLLVSSALILEGCTPRSAEVPPQSIPPDPSLAQAEVTSDAQMEEPTAVPSSSATPPAVTNSGRSTAGSYSNPFFWGYGSGYGRSWSSTGSSSSSRISSGSSGFYSGSGPTSHFGAQNSAHPSASNSTSHSSPTVHSSTTHTSTPHTTSSSSVSRGGFGGHSSSASS